MNKGPTLAPGVGVLTGAGSGGEDETMRSGNGVESCVHQTSASLPLRGILFWSHLWLIGKKPCQIDIKEVFLVNLQCRLRASVCGQGPRSSNCGQCGAVRYFLHDFPIQSPKHMDESKARWCFLSLHSIQGPRGGLYFVSDPGVLRPEEWARQDLNVSARCDVCSR